MPLNEAEAVQQVLRAQHEINQAKGPKVPMPQGQRISAVPFINYHYQGPDATLLLGSPQSILKQPNPKSKYVWRTFKKDAVTAARLRAGIYRAVELTEIQEDNPLAEYVEVKTPDGTFVTWNDQAIFEMPPKYTFKYYDAHEQWAVARLAQQTMGFAAQIEDATSGAYRGTATIGARSRQ